MAQFSDDLGSMVGRVVNFRPGVSDLLIRGWINDRIRQVLDARTFWCDLVRQGILSVPDPYLTGTVSVTPGFPGVTGVATAWPVNDVVGTTLDEAVVDIGYVEAVPVSMTGITENSYLYLDSGGPQAEAVPVVETKGDRFIAKFAKTHAAGATITQSSLVNRQFRTADTDPIFTVRNVISPTSLELTDNWGGPAKSAVAYRILVMYVMLAPRLKSILDMKDETYGRPIRPHVSLREANYRDPRRSMRSLGGALHLVDFGPNEQGNMLYELWPAMSSARQISYWYHIQWPELVADTDRPPWFINPTIFVHGAIADALRHRKNKDDLYFNPDLAKDYEQRFMFGMQQAYNADEAKSKQALQFDHERMFSPGGADFWQGNDPDVYTWNM